MNFAAQAFNLNDTSDQFDSLTGRLCIHPLLWLIALESTGKLIIDWLLVEGSMSVIQAKGRTSI